MLTKGPISSTHPLFTQFHSLGLIVSDKVFDGVCFSLSETMKKCVTLRNGVYLCYVRPNI